MLRIYLILILIALPLRGQSALDLSHKVDPDATPTVAPATPAGPAVIGPGLGAPPPGAPIPGLPPTNFGLPAAPITTPELVQVTVTPGTVREGLTDDKSLKTTVTLSAPAVQDFVCHVVSSDPNKVVCGDIAFSKGEQEEVGAVQIKWINIRHNCQVRLKAFDDADPETIVRSRIYLRKKLD